MRKTESGRVRKNNGEGRRLREKVCENKERGTKCEEDVAERQRKRSECKKSKMKIRIKPSSTYILVRYTVFCFLIGCVRTIF